MEYGSYKEYTRVHTKIIFDLLRMAVGQVLEFRVQCSGPLGLLSAGGIKGCSYCACFLGL